MRKNRSLVFGGRMKRTILQLAGIMLVILGVIFPTYLSINKLISEGLFALMFVAFLAGGFLIYKIEDIVEFESSLIKLKTIQKEIFAKADEVKKLSKELNQDKRELKKTIITFTETLYLSLSTRHRFPIPQKVSDKITKNLNFLASLAVKGKKDEIAFKNRMKEVQNLLEKEVNR